MAIDISYVNTYNYAIDQASLSDNIKLVLNNATQKNANANSVFEQNMMSNNSALLSEYIQNVGRSNVAQQLVLDANLKETLKFLCSEAAKKMSQDTKNKKFGSIVEHIFTDNKTKDFKSDEDEKENELMLESFGIEVDNSKENIFAA